MRRALRGRGPYALLVAGVMALDQLTKLLVAGLLELHESRPILEGLVSLTHVRNRGAAFGLFNETALPFQAAIFTAASLVALAGIAFYALRLPVGHRLTQTALALVLGGALGNLIDRARLGYVVDFVDVYWQRHHWPAFNVADSAITIGVCLLLLDILRSPDPAEGSEVAAPASLGRGE